MRSPSTARSTVALAEAPPAPKPAVGSEAHRRPEGATRVIRALDIGGHALKSITVFRVGGAVHVADAAWHRLPPILRAGRGRRVLDRMHLARRIEAVLKRTGGGDAAGSVNLVLSGESLRYQVFEFTSHHEARLRDEGSLGRTILRYLGMARPGAGEDQLLAVRSLYLRSRHHKLVRGMLAVAASRTAVEHRIAMLREAGHEVERVCAASIAFESLLARPEVMEASCPGAAGAENLGVLHLGARASELTFYRHGKLVFARTVRTGGDHLTDALRGGLGEWLEFSPEDQDRAQHPDTEAERHKRRFGLAIGRLEPVAGRLAREIGDALREAFPEPKRRPAAILLAGAAARTPGLAERLGEGCGVAVAVIRFPENWVEGPDARRRASILTRSPDLAPALAAVLDRDTPPDLMLQEIDSPAGASMPVSRRFPGLLSWFLFGTGLGFAVLLAAAYLNRVR